MFYTGEGAFDSAAGGGNFYNQIKETSQNGAGAYKQPEPQGYLIEKGSELESDHSGEWTGKVKTRWTNRENKIYGADQFSGEAMVNGGDKFSETPDETDTFNEVSSYNGVDISASGAFTLNEGNASD